MRTLMETRTVGHGGTLTRLNRWMVAQLDTRNKPFNIIMEREQQPVQIGQFVLARALGIGAFGKV